MIKHIVFWQFKEEALGNTKAQNMQLVKEKLMALQGVIPGMLEIEVGLGGSELECTYDVCLYTVFTDKAALDGYQIHPAHEEVKQLIGQVRSARQCMDYAV
ncbi:Dabb family protein [Limnobacter sp.]|uniref:Dabb family protein n=1 Tax=Limnobacter sp. TaxID=2003368 RepID=UPI003516C788